MYRGLRATSLCERPCNVGREGQMLIGQYDYEIERILQASSKIKKQFSNLLEREIKRMIERDDKTENYQTRDHYRNYAAWLQRVKELINQRPEND